ncbi:YybH family protein [Mycobacterium asiaticum]|uniref:YybH family protein n=1 Tax=Mycobacterium asiaticum TaxID=1790 RepID=UPI0007EFB9E6|nr:nuclear transport factor 2 family protein [Mycobacterium asiaticum]OBI98525.1 hypothetical protein A5661_15020 [Mycobacterium asiaticum]
MTSSDDPMAAVRAFADAFNAGDAKAMSAVCADPMHILDGMSPHVFQGPTAAEDWYAHAVAEAEHFGITDYHIELGEPRHADITGDNAYVVVPTSLSHNRQGRSITQTGAVMTLALRKIDGHWRLTAWAWAKGNT